MDTPSPDRRPGRDILRDATLVVTKIGGENAPSLRDNFRTISARRAEGKKQILAFSALRSTSSDDNFYTHPSAADRDASDHIKPGFNTTSHLIELGKRLRTGDLDTATELLMRVCGFMKKSIERELIDEEDEEQLILCLHAVIDRVIKEFHQRMERQGNRKILEIGKDWLLKDDEGIVSITGLGERLAQEIYQEYFTQRGLASRPLPSQGLEEVWGADPEETGRSAERMGAAIDALQTLVRDRIAALLPESDVIVSGGYLPALGSQRGYGDKTGALLACASREIEERMAYLIEKRSPIRSADPHVIPSARVVGEMTYDLAMEAFGNIHGADGKAIHPEALAMLAHAGIETLVLNPSNVEAGVTRIHAYEPEPRGIEIVASRPMPVALQVQSTKMFGSTEFAEQMSAWFSSRGISIDQIFATEVTITFTFTNDSMREIRAEEFQRYLATRFADHDLKLSVIKDRSLLFCLGNDLSGLASFEQIVRGLREAGVPDVDAITRSTRQVISFMVDHPIADAALKSLHHVCIEERESP